MNAETISVTVYDAPGVDMEAETEHVTQACAAISDARFHLSHIRGRQNRSVVAMALQLVETRAAREARAENEAAAEIVRRRVLAEERERRQREQLAAFGLTSGAHSEAQTQQRQRSAETVAAASAAVEARPVRQRSVKPRADQRSVKTDAKVQAVADALKSGQHRNHGAVAVALGVSQGELSRCKALALGRGLLTLADVRFA